MGASRVGAARVQQAPRPVAEKALARVVLLCRDLLFGSNVEGALRAGDHEVRRVATPAEARAAAGEADLVVLDLTDEGYDGPEEARAFSAAGVKTLGFYPHVDQETRKRAEDAGIDLVVPRSRMARESAALVERLTR